VGNSTGFRIGGIAVLCVAAALVVALVVTDTSGDAAYMPPNVDQTEMVLRLSDLPPGYVNGYLGEGFDDGDPRCSAVKDPPGAPARLSEFVEAYHPSGCVAAYAARWTFPGEPSVASTVASGVLALGSAEAVDAAWEAAPTVLLGRVFPRSEPTEVEPQAMVGVRTRLFHTRATLPYSYGGNDKASFLIWQTGNTMATVMAVGRSYATTDRVAAELAPRQTKRIRKPTPFRQSERYDGEVGLDDPQIDVPVYWLGRTFKPGNGMPPNELFESYWRGKPEAEKSGSGRFFSPQAPAGPLTIRYYNFRLDTWTPSTWRVFAGSKSARVLTTWECTEIRTIKLPGGSATIFGGYARDFKDCPSKPPSVFTAWVNLGGVKVVVNPPESPDGGLFSTPYSSFAGMEAIARGLKLREQPLF